ncbi:MAG: type 12 methyltransferase [Candidatus Falkowbacteria bacterium GW2011_GWC2_38_22]|uniref:Type 12 methyltransferase n=1 Tax=Candidatus Falkowbacteria bacterium GW2011_GWE1_38_31 TaxID=1618638 RepID=A0A0G0M8D7_9BACT|nr:MAG: type 12 methyltransferase [Candidatus Falkowbacteria bacterium GW2011_GWF2_38_1205]KKQ61267.1 MAG: type 12 methyltransferase [Candidatus Falkowbacteria bacterium GW2011_GWC2_38_22]KKQ63161.1 MAG: type 12 methyltransferase [Candidatus Falkowbacteria bacterium GW2011_GWF1_38_22]KKQ65358.1 MAG: type 12 methyltransferase [Candidatus Falkowbacteria bacterium GW2011_GWE2_38_254]KKQ69934.1 MAG: type 12 methyltransferase [Candidatus Falkowbacteria bacterium GW2011_GWE1_38_31]KKQ72498.1 MAG: ty
MRGAVNFFFPPLLKLFGGSFKNLKILDVGCNCGGFSFEASKYGPKEIIGIDADGKNIEQANAIRKHLGTKNVKFLKLTAEEINKEDFGKFDITILAGILYHLEDPIGMMKRISEVTNSTLLIDAHVHYNNEQSEDIPSWWMLNDMDENDFEGLFVGDEILSKEKYIKFERQAEIDYGKLQNQFISSPHTERELKFIKEHIPHPSRETWKKYGIGASSKNNLALIPNKKALIKLLRYFGFEDILEVIPQRFFEIPYKMKYRIGLIAMKRDKKGPFPISEYQKLREG